MAIYELISENNPEKFRSSILMSVPTAAAVTVCLQFNPHRKFTLLLNLIPYSKRVRYLSYLVKQSPMVRIFLQLVLVIISLEGVWDSGP